MARNNQNKVAQVEQIESVEEHVEQVVQTETEGQIEQVAQVEEQTNEVEVQVETLDGLMNQFKTKSAVIRYLKTKGMTTSGISKFMGIRYQHVRNVLTQPLKKV